MVVLGNTLVKYTWALDNCFFAQLCKNGKLNCIEIVNY